MAMEGPILCRPAMQTKVPAAVFCNSQMKSGQLGTAFFGAISQYRNITRLVSSTSMPFMKNSSHVCCAFSSSSDGNGYTAGKFNDNNGDYVNSTVLEAVEVRSGSEGYIIKMRDGKNLRCVHNNSQGRNIPESAPQPAIVLRIEDGSGTLLPIIVLEMPSVLLMAAIRNVHIARPTIYQVVKEMIDKMGYEVKLVRVNKRIQEAYCAELYLTKIDNPTESITFDLRPSDAINIAVRCKVPVQVHRSLAHSDGIRPVEPARMAVAAGLSEGLLFTELDRPDGQPCVEAQEFGLVRNMLIAAVEERYKDAGNDPVFQWLHSNASITKEKGVFSQIKQPSVLFLQVTFLRSENVMQITNHLLGYEQFTSALVLENDKILFKPLRDIICIEYGLTYRDLCSIMERQTDAVEV